MNRIDQLKAFLKESPSDSFLIFALAKEYEKLDDLDQAASLYHSIYTNDPDYVGMYYHLGKLHFRRGEIQNAFEIYSEGMKVAKAQDDQHAYNELAGARLEIDEDDLEE